MQQLCHARKPNRCAVTEHSSCPENCVFFKTPEQFRADFLKAKQRLDRLRLTGELRRQYTAFNRMCRKFTNEGSVSK